MAYAAVAIALLSLFFTLASFWWLHARRGRLELALPLFYAFSGKPRLRFPLAFFNTGAEAFIVTDLRLMVEGEAARSPLAWITTRNRLRPDADDGFAFATPFSVLGRSTREVIAEFGDHERWVPAAGRPLRLRAEAKVHSSPYWRVLLAFDWWPPPLGASTGQYLADRNEASAPATAEQ